MNTASFTFLLFGFSLSIAAHAGERVFFALDDHSIPWQHNLKVTLVAAEKHPGNPVLRRGPAGAPDHGHAATITVNRTQHEVVWPKIKTTSLPTGQPLAAKVKLPAGSKARIFALYVTE